MADAKLDGNNLGPAHSPNEKMIGAALHDFNFSSQYPESSEFSSEKTPRDQKRPLFPIKNQSHPSFDF